MNQSWKKSILSKFIKNGEKVFDDFKIIDLFKLIASFSRNDFGTINF